MSEDKLNANLIAEVIVQLGAGLVKAETPAGDYAAQVLELARAYRLRWEDLKTKDEALGRRNREIAALRDRIKHLVEARTAVGSPSTDVGHLRSMLERAAATMQDVVAKDAPEAFINEWKRERALLCREIEDELEISRSWDLVDEYEDVAGRLLRHVGYPEGSRELPICDERESWWAVNNGLVGYGLSRDEVVAWLAGDRVSTASVYGGQLYYPTPGVWRGQAFSAAAFDTQQYSGIVLSVFRTDREVTADEVVS